MLALAHAFTVLNCEQQSPAWAQARLGQFTGSRAADMLAQPRSGQGESVSRRHLRVQLALERVTGRSHAPTFCSPAMQQGRDRQAAAVGFYEALTGRLVLTSGFLQAHTCAAGVSLDGHVGDFSGIVEIKCPLAATHLDHLMGGGIPPRYRLQIVHALWITGAAWCDWVSYSPEFPLLLQARVVRVERDAREIASYALAAALFLRAVDQTVEAMTGSRAVA